MFNRIFMRLFVVLIIISFPVLSNASEVWIISDYKSQSEVVGVALAHGVITASIISYDDQTITSNIIWPYPVPHSNFKEYGEVTKRGRSLTFHAGYTDASYIENDDFTIRLQLSLGFGLSQDCAISTSLSSLNYYCQSLRHNIIPSVSAGIAGGYKHLGIGVDYVTDRGFLPKIGYLY
jgi:hypothetical protein